MIKLWTAANYVAVEIQQNGKEKELIRILVEAGWSKGQIRRGQNGVNCRLWT